MINTKELKSFEEVQSALNSGEQISFGLRFWGEAFYKISPDELVKLQAEMDKPPGGLSSELFPNSGLQATRKHLLTKESQSA